MTTLRPEATGKKICANSGAVANFAQGAAPQSALAHSIDDVTRITSSGRTAVFHAIKIGDLKARKLGRRTVILDHDLRAWLASLPLAGQPSTAA